MFRYFSRYFSSQLDSASDPAAAASKLPQLAKDNILGLIDIFILHMKRPSTKSPAPSPPLPSGFPGGGGHGDYHPPLSAVEEMQLLLTIHSQLQDQKSLEMRFCIFDTVFGGDGEDSVVRTITLITSHKTNF